MDSQRREIWNVLPVYLERFVKKFAKATPQEKADLERKWFDPRRGVIRRLLNKPFFAEARPSAQQIFLWLLEDRFLKVATD